MPEMLSIEVQPRTVSGKKVKSLRRQGVVPGVIYGHDVSLRAVQMEERGVDRFLARLGGSSLFSVRVSGEDAPRPAIIRAVQRDILTQRVTHVDFLQVSLSERIRSHVPVVFVGEAPAVSAGVGEVVHGIPSLEVECLPTELPSAITVDISGLAQVDDTITVGDLQLPAGVVVHAAAEQMVARVVAERAIEEEETPVEVVEAPPEVEVIVERKAKERRERTDQES